jgi:SAM-dependent methyltransferase
MALPWWTKIAAKIVLARLPFGYGVWQRLGLFRHGQMDSSDYAIRIFDEHVTRAGLTGKLAGKTLLELGPGDSFASAVIAAAHGASAILVDSGHYARPDVAPYLALERRLRERGLDPPQLAGARDSNAVLERCRARYLTRGLESLRTLETASVDLMFSQAVLEHVRKKDFLATQQECRRILRPGGIGSHQIDLRDHLGGALNNLRFSDRTWESDFFARSGFYTNRISFTPMIGLFRDAGFDVQVGNVRRWPALPTPRPRLAREFRSVSDEELCVSGFEVLLR